MKYLALLFSTLLTSLSYSQAVVTDPGAYAWHGQKLTQATAQLTQLQQTYKTVRQGLDEAKKTTETLSKIKNTVEDINDAFRTVQKIDNLINMQTLAINRIDEQISIYKKSKAFTSDELLIITSNMGYFISVTSASIQTANLILKKDFWKMDDAQRLERLDKIQQQMYGVLADIQAMFLHYSRIANKRMIRNAFTKPNY